MTIKCPIVITVVENVNTPICYRGYKIYPPGYNITISEWEGQPYHDYYLVYMSNLPVVAGNVNWRAAASLEAIKQTIDTWSSGIQGGQC